MHHYAILHCAVMSIRIVLERYEDGHGGGGTTTRNAENEGCRGACELQYRKLLNLQ